MSYEEAGLSQGFKDALKARYGAYSMKFSPSKYGRSGIADIYVCLPPSGRSLWIESKIPEKWARDAHNMTLVQVEFGRKIIEHGGLWVCACSFDMIEETIARQDDTLWWEARYAELDEFVVVLNVKRSEARKRRRHQGPMTASQLEKSLYHIRNKNRKVRLKRHDFTVLHTPTVEG